jgi:predicted DNA-binding ribbon-helix-helix protein
MMQSGANVKTELKTKKEAKEATVRASVSFPHGIYRMLEDIARQKKVSVAWVVREATEHYIADKWPLFPKPDQKD